MCSVAGENWRKQNKSVSSRLKSILRKELFTDVTVNVQGKEFKCHSLILTIGSPYFERTFHHTFKTSRFPPNNTLWVSDITPEAFQCILSYLYTDQVTFGSEMQAFQTYEAADKFEIDDLKSECEIFLSELEIRPRTIWSNLERAAALKMEKMQRKYMTYLGNNTDKCLQEDTFLKTNEEVLLKILKSEKLRVTEIELLSRLAAWVESRHSNPSKTRFSAYLCHIRFRAMTAKEFCNFIQTYPDVIDARDSLAILQHLELPYKNSLPAWCSRQPRRIWPYD